MSTATDLSPDIWNAIADLVARSSSSREVFFVKVKKVDKINKTIFVEDFGDIGIPLVSFNTSFSYVDTEPVGNAVSGSPIGTRRMKREDTTQTNPALQTVLVMPKVGELVVVLDPWGGKRFPICIGVLHSKAGFWEE